MRQRNIRQSIARVKMWSIWPPILTSEKRGLEEEETKKRLEKTRPEVRKGDLLLTIRPKEFVITI